MSKILCIFDGFGLLPKSENNAASLAKMPNFKYLLQNYFWTTLNADGEKVGQEDGLVGNSEVGHMNIGGLKLVPQLSYQITKSADKSFSLDKNIAPDQLFDPTNFLKQNFSQNPEKNKTIHLIGLFSTGTIHSDLRHWVGAIESTGTAGADKIVMHIISDGRDSDRQSLVATWDYFVSEFADRLKTFENKIFLGSVGGRFYALDRDKNWARVARGLLPMLNPDLIWKQESRDINYEDSFYLKPETVELFKKYDLKMENVFGVASSDFQVYRENDYQNIFTIGGAIDEDKWLNKWQIPDINPWTDLQKKGISNLLNKPISEIVDENLEKYGRTAGLDRIKTLLSCVVESDYNDSIFDENISPRANKNDLNNQISKNDTLWLINFRTDRMKQFAEMLLDINKEFELNLTILANNNYGTGKEIYLDSSLENNSEKDGYFPIFKNQPVTGTLAEYISQIGNTQLHIAETEKYNHVTFFMNGGQDKKTQNEDWVVIPSNKVASHAEKPEMKAKEVTDHILENGMGFYDFIIVNYANPDMVGHTGDIKAATYTMEVLDECLGRLIKACEEGGHSLILTADHGNVEKVGIYTENGKEQTDTEHNANPVPFIILDKKFKVNQSGQMDTNDMTQIIEKLEYITQNGISNPDKNLLESVIFTEKNQVLLGENEWLELAQIPTPRLPLWYTGLLLILI